MARDFNGSTQGLGVAAAPSAYPVTLAAWVQPDTVASVGGVVACVRVAAPTNHLLTMQVGTPSSTVGLTLRAGGTSTDITGGAPGTGTWRHLAARFLSGNVFLYLDGTQVATTTHALSFPSITDTDVGCRQNGSSALAAFLDGRIGEAIVYAGDIGADGVAELAAGATFPMVLPTLGRNYWPLVTDLTDHFGSNNLSERGSGTSSLSEHSMPIIYLRTAQALSSQLRTVVADLIGRRGVLAASLNNALAVSADLIGRRPQLSANLNSALTLTAALVGKRPDLAAALVESMDIVAALVGRRPDLAAALVEELTISAAMVGQRPVLNASLAIAGMESLMADLVGRRPQLAASILQALDISVAMTGKRGVMVAALVQAVSIAGALVGARGVLAANIVADYFVTVDLTGRRPVLATSLAVQQNVDILVSMIARRPLLAASLISGSAFEPSRAIVGITKIPRAIIPLDAS